MAPRRDPLKNRRLHLVLVVLLLAPSALVAQNADTFSASVLGGLGGALDEEPDAGVTNPSFQLGFAWQTDDNTRVGLRLGQLDFGSETVNTVREGDLTYFTLAGEYRFTESYYESGLYLGVGGYRLEGVEGLTPFDDTAIGLAAGVTGEFTVTRRWAILVELSAHYADLDRIQIFAMAHGGVTYRF